MKTQPQPQQTNTKKEIKNWKEILFLFDYITDVKLVDNFELNVYGMKDEKEIKHVALYTFNGVADAVKEKLDNFINIK